MTTTAMVKLIDSELAEKLGLKIILADDLLADLQKHPDSYEWKTDANTLVHDAV